MVGNENLAAVEHPFLTVEHSRRLLTGSVGTGIGLGKAESADPLARSQLGQILHLLLLGACLQYRRSAQRRMSRQNDARSGAHAAQLLNGHTVHNVRTAGTAVLGRNRNTHQADFGHFLYRLHRETLLLVDLCGEGLHLLLCKFANHLQEEFFLFRETKIHIFECVNSLMR